MSPEAEKAAFEKSLAYLETHIDAHEKELSAMRNDLQILRDVPRTTVDELFARACDKHEIEKVVNVWAEVLDEHIGRGVRKLLWTAIVIVGALIGTKLDPFGWFK